MEVQRSRRERQLVSLFSDGLRALEMDSDTIPNLDAVNKRLLKLTGWQGVFVEGLANGADFYSLLKERKFPIGSFIRDKRDLGYTPAPDVLHDLYGHIPFFADRDYADFCQRFGETAMRYAGEPEKFRQFERVFWFTIEFGLVDTPKGTRIFGAGIASSIGECEYALSSAPEILPFDIETIRRQEFRIDEMQKRLFKLESPQQLYASLELLR
jgi:phenylalanine-4-hydroxylase